MRALRADHGALAKAEAEAARRHAAAVAEASRRRQAALSALETQGAQREEAALAAAAAEHSTVLATTAAAHRTAVAAEAAQHSTALASLAAAHSVAMAEEKARTMREVALARATAVREAQQQEQLARRLVDWRSGQEERGRLDDASAAIRASEDTARLAAAQKRYGVLLQGAEEQHRVALETTQARRVAPRAATRWRPARWVARATLACGQGSAPASPPSPVRSCALVRTRSPARWTAWDRPTLLDLLFLGRTRSH